MIPLERESSYFVGFEFPGDALFEIDHSSQRGCEINCLR
jgi:hypothetical protein